MRLPNGLRKLDDRVLGSRGNDRAPADEHGAPDEHRTDEPHTESRAESRADAADARTESRTEPHADARPERTERTARTTRTEGAGPRTGGGDGLSSFLAVVWRVARLVLVALALLLLLAVAFILLPANEDNVIVRNVVSLADTVAGPFRDVFDADDPDRMRIYNYGLAAVVYFILGSIVGKLPTGSKRPGS